MGRLGAGDGDTPLLTAETVYALRALLFFAARPGNAVGSASELARGTGMPYEFTRKVLRKCARAGLLSAARGASGGFALARPPWKVTLLDAVTAVQGRFVPARSDALDALGEAMENARDALERTLGRTTLSDLV